MLPLYLVTRLNDRPLRDGTGIGEARGATAAVTVSIVVGGVAVALWCLLLPSAYVVTHAAPPLENERLLNVTEGSRKWLPSQMCRAKAGRFSQTAIECHRRRGSPSGTCVRWHTFRSSPWTPLKPSS